MYRLTCLQFILGDTSPHYSGKTHAEAGPKWDQVYSNMRTAVKMLVNKFPETKIIPALGNHDSYPFDIFEDMHLEANKDNDTVKNFYTNYVKRGAFGDMFKKFGSKAHEIRDSFEENCGFYVAKDVIPFYKDKYNVSQTFIVLNTNMYYYNNATLIKEDPCGQLALLNAHLANVTDKENVFIVAHIPPGFFDLHPREPFFQNENITRRMVDIFTKKEYAEKIVAHFYGHTHTSSFRLFFDRHNTSSAPRGVGFIAPSITPRVIKLAIIITFK